MQSLICCTSRQLYTAQQAACQGILFESKKRWLETKYHHMAFGPHATYYISFTYSIQVAADPKHGAARCKGWTLPETETASCISSSFSWRWRFCLQRSRVNPKHHLSWCLVRSSRSAAKNPKSEYSCLLPELVIQHMKGPMWLRCIDALTAKHTTGTHPANLYKSFLHPRLLCLWSSALGSLRKTAGGNGWSICCERSESIGGLGGSGFRKAHETRN